MVSAPFVLLALAIATVWLPAVRVSGRPVPLCWAVYLVAVGAAAFHGHVSAPGVLGLAVLVGLAATYRRAATPWWRWGSLALLVLTALALSLHLWPGFTNPVLFADLQASTNSVPFTQYLNFDKGSVGFVLLALLRRRSDAAPVAAGRGRQALLIVAATVATVFALGLASGHLVFEPKFPPMAWAFLATNLFFTCVAEECFFRRLVQDNIAGRESGRARARVVASVVISAGLFGLAHFKGGPTFVWLATVAGLGAALVHARVGRVEYAIAAHFLLNALHFVLFAYPSAVGRT